MEVSEDDLVFEMQKYAFVYGWERVNSINKRLDTKFCLEDFEEGDERNLVEKIANYSLSQGHLEIVE